MRSLFAQFPDYQEGDLTKVKSVVVSRKTCAKFSLEIGLGDFLFLGKGVSNYGEIPSNMLAEVSATRRLPRRTKISIPTTTSSSACSASSARRSGRAAPARFCSRKWACAA